MHFRRQRLQLKALVTLQSASKVEKLGVLNLNETGAMLAASFTLPDGEKVTIIAEEHRIAGIVRWARDGRIGVSFVPAISREMLRSLGLDPTGPQQGARYDSSGLPVMR